MHSNLSEQTGKQKSNGMFINGKWVAGKDSVFNSFNPANNQSIWVGHRASVEQVDQCLDAAKNAFIKWANTKLDDRIKIIQQFANLVNANLDTIATIISEETGKPFWESTAEAKSIYAKADTSIEAHQKRTADIETHTAQGTTCVRYRPHGAVAVFGPYNFPGHLPNGHIIPALLAGNTIIFKPSELTPKIAEYIVSLWQQTDLPDGVLNLLQGGVQIGKTLSEHPAIDGVFFTGSSNTGKAIHKHFAGNPGKILALEMGGNNPLIVTELENVKAAIYNCIQSAFITSGQRCTCARKLFVPAGKWGDDFITDLVNATENLAIDIWNADPQPFMGPVINSIVAYNMKSAQAHFHKAGAGMILKTKHADENTGFISPGMLDITNIKDTLADEENFYPLLKVIRYKSFDEALYWANYTNFGLSAGLLSDDKNLYQQFYQTIRAGIINWNKPTTGASAKAPFGGIGDSGNFNPGAYFAADYCSYPVAGIETADLNLPENLSPGIKI